MMQTAAANQRLDGGLDDAIGQIVAVLVAAAVLGCGVGTGIAASPGVGMIVAGSVCGLFALWAITVATVIGVRGDADAHAAGPTAGAHARAAGGATAQGTGWASGGATGGGEA